MPKHTPLFVSGGSSRSYRVALPNGVAGYVAESETDPTSRAIDTVELAREVPVLDRPARDAVVMQHIDAGTTIDVLGRYGNYAWVELGTPRPTWIRTPERPAATTSP